MALVRWDSNPTVETSRGASDREGKSSEISENQMITPEGGDASVAGFPVEDLNPVTTSVPSSPAPPATHEGGGTQVNPFSGFAEAAMATVRHTLGQDVDQKRIALTRRLKLTPDQEARLTAFLQAQNDLHERLTMQILNGNMPTADEVKHQMPEAHQSEADFMKSMLSEEQFAVYKDYGAEQQQELHESLAHHDLGKLSAMFSLSEGQKDAVFMALVEAYEQKPDGASNASPENILIESQARRSAFLRERLNGILDVKDLELWLEQEERGTAAQQQMMQQFMPR